MFFTEYNPSILDYLRVEAQIRFSVFCDGNIVRQEVQLLTENQLNILKIQYIIQVSLI